MGIASIFEETANFNFMTKEPVYVGKMIQKLFVEVDEKGSEAAVATGNFIYLNNASLLQLS